MSTNNLFKTREKTWVELYNFDNMVLTNNIILEVILKGHLFIESKIEFILRLELRDPDILNLDRMHYPQKLKLLVATGIISRENYKVYKSINEIRRKFAHNIEAEITEEDVLNIIISLAQSSKMYFKPLKVILKKSKG